jgi:hypothetical protein
VRTVEEIIIWLTKAIKDNKDYEKTMNGGFSAIAPHASRLTCESLLNFINSGDEK